MYRRSSRFLFPWKFHRFVFIYCRAHFVYSRIFPERFRHAAKSRDIVVIIVVGAYVGPKESRNRNTDIRIDQLLARASFTRSKQYICCIVFPINLLNVPRKRVVRFRLFPAQIVPSILFLESSKLAYSSMDHKRPAAYYTGKFQVGIGKERGIFRTQERK